MTLPGEKRRLEWDRGSAEVWALSAGLHHLELALPDGRRVRPLAEAPWHDEPGTTGDASLAAHLRHLGGDWACIPFGRSDADPVMHGYGTDHEWLFEEGLSVQTGPGATTPTPDPSPQGGGELSALPPSPLRGGAGGGGHERSNAATLSITYPADRPIAGLSRTLRGVPDAARVEISVTAEARAACRIPVGLHPILALGRPGERVRLETAFGHGETFPAIFEPGVSRLAVAARFDSTEALPLDDGSAIAFGDMLNRTGEEAFQLFGVDGNLRVVYPDSGYAARVQWNPADFPTCLFWVSTGGRAFKPWNGRFRGFGVEPLDARFRAANGGAAIVEGRSFLAGERWTTHYSISVEPV